MTNKIFEKEVVEMAKKILDKAIEQLERAQRAVTTARENYWQAVEHYRLSDMASTINAVAAEWGTNEQALELQEKQVQTDEGTIQLKTGVPITTKSSIVIKRDTCMQRTESVEAVTRFDLSMHTQEEKLGHHPSPAAHTSIGRYVEVEVSRECDSQPTPQSPPNSPAQTMILNSEQYILRINVESCPKININDYDLPYVVDALNLGGWITSTLN
ncbi:hypothetical protein TSAR_001616 [Trichomalopsis sarcophagae]|uniref:Uncharacterized protein n=1 Tax=Trichomalopsis sarcophagae TaxID=543379 RepID=A0A232FAS3_9HYME|nr:hypothetical protein TSAR_001616 [Trichomalopsis sarcophagae]